MDNMYWQFDFECEVCGNDEVFFDRSYDVYEDRYGMEHNVGPYYRCTRCNTVCNKEMSNEDMI